MINLLAEQIARRAVADFLDGPEFTRRVLLITEKVARGRTGAVTNLGFLCVGAAELRRFWPDMPWHEAVAAMREQVEACDGFGAAGYDWSAEAARELAAIYVSDYGEAA